jgi:ATP-dependent RNA helicase UAP56/SUB2
MYQSNIYQIEYLIIDECDKMLQSDELRTDIKHIFDQLTRPKQVMMFSATMP